MESVASRIETAVARLGPEFLEFLAESVRCQSVTGHEEPVTEFYERELRALGWEVRSLPLAGSALCADEPRVGQRANVVAYRPGAGDGLTVLNGHVDVVPPGDPSEWRESPFSGHVRDGRLYGRGSVDMKGGIAAAVLALAALEDCGAQPLRDIRLELVIGEEKTGVGTRLMVEAESEAPSAVIVMEPSGGHIVPLSTGLQFFTVEVSGMAAHTSAPWRGVDAFEKLLAARDRLRRLAAARSDSYSHELFEDVPTGIPFAIGKIAAGDYPASIPAFATMSGRMGLRPGEDPEGLRAAISAALESLAEDDDWFRDHPAAVKWGNAGLRGWETPREHELVQSLVRAQEHVVGAATIAAFTAGSDAAFYGGRGIPTAIFGPGDVALAHAPDESIAVADVFTAAKVLAIALAGAA